MVMIQRLPREQVQSEAFIAPRDIVGTSATQMSFRGFVLGDTEPRWRIRSDGRFEVGAGALTVPDVGFERVAANVLGLLAGDSWRIPSDGELQFGADVVLSRGAANRLDLADGDTLSLRTAFQLRQATANYTVQWDDPAAARVLTVADPGADDTFTFNGVTATLAGKTLTAPTIAATDWANANHAHAAASSGGLISTPPIGASYVVVALDANLTGDRRLQGTANQITITDGGANGDITLSTPQNIHIAATPQFARLGLGTAASGAAGQILNVIAEATNLNNLFTEYRTVAASGPFMSIRKARGTEALPTTVITGDQIGTFGWAGHDGTDFVDVARIVGEVEGTIATNRTPGRLVFSTGTDAAPSVLTERMRISSAGNMKLAGTAARATTEGTNHLDIFDGTAPVGTLTNGISLYSTAGELRVMDSGGVATLLSPHDDNGYWIFDSKNTLTGQRLRIDVEKMLRRLNEMLGWDFIEDFAE